MRSAADFNHNGCSARYAKCTKNYKSARRSVSVLLNLMKSQLYVLAHNFK